MQSKGYAELIDAFRERFGKKTTETESALQAKSLQTELLNLLETYLQDPEDILTFEIHDPSRLVHVPEIINSKSVSDTYEIQQIDETLFRARHRPIYF